MSKRVSMDWTLFFTVAIMVAAGLVMIYSASSITSQALYNKPPYYYLLMQLGWAIAGFIVLMLLRRFDYRKLRRPEFAFGPLAVVRVLEPHQHDEGGDCPYSLAANEIIGRSELQLRHHGRCAGDDGEAEHNHRNDG